MAAVGRTARRRDIGRTMETRSIAGARPKLSTYGMTIRIHLRRRLLERPVDAYDPKYGADPAKKYSAETSLE